MKTTSGRALDKVERLDGHGGHGFYVGVHRRSRPGFEVDARKKKVRARGGGKYTGRPGGVVSRG